MRQVYEAGLSEPHSGDFILLGEDSIFDSVTALQLTLAIEQEFGVVVEDADIKPENFKNLKCLTDYVREKLSSPNSSS